MERSIPSHSSKTGITIFADLSLNRVNDRGKRNLLISLGQLDVVKGFLQWFCDAHNHDLTDGFFLSSLTLPLFFAKVAEKKVLGPYAVLGDVYGHRQHGVVIVVSIMQFAGSFAKDPRC